MVYKLIENYAYEHEDSNFLPIDGYLRYLEESGTKGSVEDFFEYCNASEIDVSFWDNFGRFNVVEFDNRDEAIMAYEKKIEKYKKEMYECFNDHANGVYHEFTCGIDEMFDADVEPYVDDSKTVNLIKSELKSLRERLKNPYPVQYKGEDPERYFPCEIELVDEDGNKIKSLDDEPAMYFRADKCKTFFEMFFAD